MGSKGSQKSKRKLRVLVLVHEDLVPPPNAEKLSEKELEPYEVEYDVISSLKEMGHEVFPLGVYSDLGAIRKALHEQEPHVTFNLLEEFHGLTVFEPHVVSYLELVKQPYTGCNPRGLMIARDKALSKKILAYHRIPIPKFLVYPPGYKVRRVARLKFPMFVKSVSEEGSTGISQASFVTNVESLAERVEFIHRNFGTAALAEEYIEGREIYVGVIGNRRLQSYTPWELVIENLAPGARYVATSRIKWNRAYQKKVGLSTRPAELEHDVKQRIEQLGKRIYRLLSLSGYARLDFRMTVEGQIYLLEANPNPNIGYGEDFAESAEHCKVSYEELLQRILNLGLSYRAEIEY